ncbi:YdeI/OmpD-associated family protein [Deinococcus sonorensis]|uniref:YdeI/OmpD-associated family protein n=1 Tax=Deinococcus sonorensis KR-87 TaxID=694439 RepID=A0AAU7U4N7_9DEIO
MPAEIIQQLGAGKKPAVHVTVNGHRYRSTVAVRGEHFMIPVSAEHRQAAGLKAGDALSVTLDLDAEPREVSVPDDLQAALLGHEAARQRFEQLSYSQKRQHTLAVEGARTAETRARRVAKAIETLAEGR